ncbi:MAG: cation-translocating P-type ATPase [Candidatus Sericytochromatia bacterium]
MSDWYQQSPEEALQTVKSRTEGLTSQEAQARLSEYGPNELKEEGIKSPWKILWEQLSSIMVVILLVAAGLSAVLGDYQDAVVILAIVVFFVSLGVFQEYRAEKAIAALKQMAVPEVKVRRDGQNNKVPAPDLVPGDILLLEAGDLVPADARLLESHSVKVQEAALTGESEAVEKQTAALDEADIGLGDRTNLLYMGTQVTYGRGVAVVVETGMKTQLGHIATMIQSVEERDTPLKQRLDQVGKTLAIVAVVCSGLIFALGIFRKEEWELMLMSAISVAVAAVPEGLPAVLTITLAFGSQRMLKRHALVRKLTGIETLGSVGVICSDKTGTLTQNVMTVTHLASGGDMQELGEEGQLPEDPAQQLLLLAGVFCNDSELKGDKALGDPTEVALLKAAQKVGLDVSGLQSQLPRQEELPFDSERKRMSTLHGREGLPEAVQSLLPEGQLLSFTKGAIDGLLDNSSQVLHQGQWVPLDDARKQELEDLNQQLAGEGRRVLGFALRSWDSKPEIKAESLETELMLIGLMGMIDPPRPEAQEAVRICREAGIRPMMITGDHPLTALKIAQELGIAENDKTLTGKDLQQYDQAALQNALKDCSVFARVSPEHKLRIVEALQADGQIVAMTGDGVNDAPALKKADIGVAMGITGTDVSKEAADMVLQDDNFATIVAAVEEGRIIYDNIRKFIKFSVAGNLGKITVMLAAPILGMPLALLPIQMLWLNLLTDGLLGLGLGLEKAEREIMRRPAVSPGDSILGGAMLFQISWMGVLIGAISMGLGGWVYFTQGAESPWQSVIFTSLALAQIFQALAIRSSKDSLFRIGLFSNPTLLGMMGAVLALQTLVIYLPLLQGFFHTQALPLSLLGVIVGANALIWGVAEAIKASGRSV